MSERILKALMQLFALVAKVDSVNNDGRIVVETFLKQQLNTELVSQYLELFEEYLEKDLNLDLSGKICKCTHLFTLQADFL